MIAGLDATTIKAGETRRFYAIFHDAAGAALTGLTPVLRIRRESDSKYLKNDATWTASPSTEYTATAVSAGDLPGVYYFDFAAPATADKFFIRWDGTASAADRYQYDYAQSVIDGPDEFHLIKAVLCNKQTQNVSGAGNAGEIIVYDDDDTTELLTLTPSADGSTQTLTPS